MTFEELIGPHFKEVLDLCAKHKLEPEPRTEGLVFISPKPLPKAAEKVLKELLPPFIPVSFEVSCKRSTLDNVVSILKQSQPKSCQVSRKERTIIFEIEGLEDTHTLNKISGVLEADGFYDSWKYVIDGQEIVVCPTVTEEISRNTNLSRTQFTDDDMLNLRILLGSTQTVDDFINSL